MQLFSFKKIKKKWLKCHICWLCIVISVQLIFNSIAAGYDISSQIGSETNKKITQNRLLAQQAVDHAIKEKNCSQFDATINKIKDGGMLMATRWFVQIIKQQCTTEMEADVLFNSLYDRNKITPIMLTQMLSFYNAKIKEMDGREIGKIKKTIEKILQKTADLTDRQQIILASTYKAISPDKKTAQKYINKVWANAQFDETNWLKFYQSHREIISQENHVKNLHKILLQNKQNLATIGVNAISKEPIRQKINLLTKTSKIKDDDTILELCADDIIPNEVGLLALKQLTKLTPEESFSILYRTDFSHNHDQKLTWMMAERLIKNLIRTKPKRYKNMIYSIINKNYGLTDKLYVRQQFKAGFVAFRILIRSDNAIFHFNEALKHAKTSYDRSQAYYWLGRVYQEKNPSIAKKYFSLAANHAFSLYGQLAAEELNLDPLAHIAIQLAQHNSEVQECHYQHANMMIEIAYLIHQNSSFWGSVHFIEDAMYELDKRQNLQICTISQIKSFINARAIFYFGSLAARLNAPISAISYPDIQFAKNSIIRSIIRKESIFRASAKSQKGAVGFMQVRSDAAKDMARKLSLTFDQTRLQQDQDYNVAIGSAYISTLLARYQSLALALASYNAGMGKVGGWINYLGNPGFDKYKILDWIELIPYQETQEYVVNIIETIAVYDAIEKFGDRAQGLSFEEKGKYIRRRTV